MDPSGAGNGSADLAAPALIGFTRAERHRSRALCCRWRWIHGQAGLDGVIPKLPAPPSPWEGSLWTPHCLGRPSSRAQGRGTHPSTFIIIPGSKFSSFGIFSPTVVALSSSSPSEVQDPLPCAGAQSPASIRAGWRWGLPNPFGEGSSFPPSHLRRMEEPLQPRGTRDIPGPGQDPACGAQSSAPHPSGDKDTPGHCPAPSSQSGKSHQDRGPSQSLAEGWDKVKREVEQDLSSTWMG